MVFFYRNCIMDHNRRPYVVGLNTILLSKLPNSKYTIFMCGWFVVHKCCIVHLVVLEQSLMWALHFPREHNTTHYHHVWSAADGINSPTWWLRWLSLTGVTGMAHTSHTFAWKHSTSLHLSMSLFAALVETLANHQNMSWVRISTVSVFDTHTIHTFLLNNVFTKHIQ